MNRYQVVETWEWGVETADQTLPATATTWGTPEEVARGWAPKLSGKLVRRQVVTLTGPWEAAP